MCTEHMAQNVGVVDRYGQIWTICDAKSGLRRVRTCCMLVLHSYCAYVCDSGVTARSGYQTNAVQVHDFIRTVATNL